MVQNFRKVILWEYDDLWRFFFFFFFGGGGGWGGHFWVITKSDNFFYRGGGRSFLFILGLFKVKIQNGNIFWAAKFQIFLGMPDIPDFFFGGGGGWG